MTPGPVAPVSIRDIPRTCVCDWAAPDYSRPPGERSWSLRAADPRCTVHRAEGRVITAPPAARRDAMACVKVRFLSRAEAKLAIRQARGRGYGYLREYRCPGCGFYHLTSRKPQRAGGHE